VGYACSHFEQDNEARDGICIVYLTGFMEGYGFGSGISTASDFCIPSEVTMIQTALVVKKFLLSNPEKLHEGMGALTYNALSSAFPCRGQQKKKGK
jgi:hypothetical protein